MANLVTGPEYQITYHSEDDTLEVHVHEFTLFYKNYHTRDTPNKHIASIMAGTYCAYMAEEKSTYVNERIVALDIEGVLEKWCNENKISQEQG